MGPDDGSKSSKVDMAAPGTLVMLEHTLVIIHS
jgi:hypothetical protein